MQTSMPIIPVDTLKGQFRRFGETGPVYEIIGIDRRKEDGEWAMRIVLVETGEEEEYPLLNILDDPIAE